MSPTTGVTLLVGGARSGKSALAERRGRAHGGPVVVIATAEAGDDDMAARIARHRADRPAGWATIEEPIGLGAAVRAVDADALVIVDCVTLWVTNLVLAGRDEAAVLQACEDLAAALTGRAGPAIVVTNEVGLGVHPESELGRVFRDVLGRVNQHLAASADRTLLLVAGRVLELRDPDEVAW